MTGVGRDNHPGLVTRLQPGRIQETHREVDPEFHAVLDYYLVNTYGDVVTDEMQQAGGKVARRPY
jgi:hypothetical protein